MKKLQVLFAILIALPAPAQEREGVKPGILVNGSPCLIQNLIYSCIPRTCDSIVILAGDSIEFCTYQAIELNVDTAYWLRWYFYGATNLPDTIQHSYSTQTPLCHTPRWDSAGTYVVEVFYNGDLTAYPTCDCYQQGPSHWFVKIVVLPDPNGIQAHAQSDFPVTPNPSDGMFTFDPEVTGEIVVYDYTGREILRTRQNRIDLSSFGSGMYNVLIISDCEVHTAKLIVR